jgi:hypothetical protein
MIPQSEGPTGHVGTRRDSKWDTILPWMGHHFAQMGHHSVPMGHHSAPMGHHSAMMGHEMGHHSAPMGHHFVQMGHERTPTDTKMVCVGVMVKR